MPQISKQPLPKSTWKHIWSYFIQATANMQDANKAEVFMRSLLTDTEQIMLAKRLMVGALTHSGWNAYDIAQALKVSTSTVYKLQQQYKLSSEFRQIIATSFPEKISLDPEYKKQGKLDKLITNFFKGRHQRQYLSKIGEPE